MYAIIIIETVKIEQSPSKGNTKSMYVSKLKAFKIISFVLTRNTEKY